MVRVIWWEREGEGHDRPRISAKHCEFYVRTFNQRRRFRPLSFPFRVILPSSRPFDVLRARDTDVSFRQTT